MGVRKDARSLNAKSLARRSRAIAVLIGIGALVASLAGVGSTNTDCAPLMLRYDLEGGAVSLRVCALIPLPPAEIVVRYDVDVRLSLVSPPHHQ